MRPANDVAADDCRLDSDSLHSFERSQGLGRLLKGHMRR